MNLGELKTLVRAKLHDTKHTSDAAIVADLNTAQDLIVAVIGATFSDEVTINLVSSTAVYTLPVDWLQIIKVQYDDGSAKRDIPFIGRDEYYDIETNSIGGTPTNYTLNGSSLVVYPTPASITSETLLCVYSKSATSMVDDTDIPFNDDDRFVPLHSKLTYYALAQGKLAEGDATGFSIYNKLWNDMLDYAKSFRQVTTERRHVRLIKHQGDTMRPPYIPWRA